MSYTLTVEGLIEPSEHETLAAAVSALRKLLAELPLIATDRVGFDLILSDPAWADDYIRRDGRMNLQFTAAGGTFTAVIAPRTTPVDQD
ncbi:hypothetical protein [Kitasatospora sp. NPDC087314]|uniref:hypothetical protein n=1 Tax=Kitasatospora sp. NPDC087314 TaxID=3364068 RepID=UPI003827F858